MTRWQREEAEQRRASERRMMRLDLTLFLLLAAGLVAGCITVTSARHMVAGAFQAERLAAETFKDLDAEKQDAIEEHLAATGDLKKVEADRDAWRAERKKGRQGFKTVHAALVGAAVTVELAASGQKVDLGKVMQNVSRALSALRAMLAAFGIQLVNTGGVL